MSDDEEEDKIIAAETAARHVWHKGVPPRKSEMPIGPGKYDDLCTYVAEKSGIATKGGAAIVIIVGGNRGNGFSVQSDYDTAGILPDMLEYMAKEIRKDTQ